MYPAPAPLSAPHRTSQNSALQRLRGSLSLYAAPDAVPTQYNRGRGRALSSRPLHFPRHMPGRDMLPRGFGVDRRIVEEDVGAEGFEERAFRAAAEEQRLVDAH